MRSTYGLNITYVRFSAIFSTPRCRYPMMHSVPITFSPSSFKITRSTPCVEGCCGPILRTNSVESRNVVSGMDLLAALDVQILPYPALVLLNQAVFLAQREAFPLFGEQDAAHVRVAFKLNAEHVEDLAFQPVCGGVHRRGRRRLEAIGDCGLDPDSFVPGEAIEDVDYVETLGPLWVIDGGEIDEVIEIGFKFQEFEYRDCGAGLAD